MLHFQYRNANYTNLDYQQLERPAPLEPCYLKSSQASIDDHHYWRNYVIKTDIYARIIRSLKDLSPTHETILALLGRLGQVNITIYKDKKFRREPQEIFIFRFGFFAFHKQRMINQMIHEIKAYVAMSHGSSYGEVSNEEPIFCITFNDESISISCFSKGLIIRKENKIIGLLVSIPDENNITEVMVVYNLFADIINLGRCIKVLYSLKAYHALSQEKDVSQSNWKKWIKKYWSKGYSHRGLLPDFSALTALFSDIFLNHQDMLNGEVAHTHDDVTLQHWFCHDTLPPMLRMVKTNHSTQIGLIGSVQHGLSQQTIKHKIEDYAMQFDDHYFTSSIILYRNLVKILIGIIPACADDTWQLVEKAVLPYASLSMIRSIDYEIFERRCMPFSDQLHQASHADMSQADAFDSKVRWALHTKKYGQSSIDPQKTKQLDMLYASICDILFHQWTMAYERIIEILLAVAHDWDLKAQPLKIDDYWLVMGKRLEPTNIAEVKSYHRPYAYAMNAMFHLIHWMLDAVLGKRPDITCLDTLYFEFFHQFESTENITIRKIRTIDELETLPDLLITEIHTNNASSAVVSAHDICAGLNHVLEKNKSTNSKPVHIILDLTLNNPSELVIQQWINTLLELGDNINIYVVLSLTKMMQMGVDLVSGGVCLAYGKHLVIPDKVNEYFKYEDNPNKALLNILTDRRFEPHRREFFKLLRSNANIMYSKLKSMLVNQSRSCGGLFKVGISKDVELVYVSIQLDEHIHAYLARDNQDMKKAIMSVLQNHIIQAAWVLGIQLTGRNSFGFLMSCINLVGSSWRLTAGAQPPNSVDTLIDFIASFLNTLSMYVNDQHTKHSDDPPLMDWIDQHAKDFIGSCEKYRCGRPLPNQRVKIIDPNSDHSISKLVTLSIEPTEISLIDEQTQHEQIIQDESPIALLYWLISDSKRLKTQCSAGANLVDDGCGLEHVKRGAINRSMLAWCTDTYEMFQNADASFSELAIGHSDEKNCELVHWYDDAQASCPLKDNEIFIFESSISHMPICFDRYDSKDKQRLFKIFITHQVTIKRNEEKGIYEVRFGSCRDEGQYTAVCKNMDFEGSSSLSMSTQTLDVISQALGFKDVIAGVTASKFTEIFHRRLFDHLVRCPLDHQQHLCGKHKLIQLAAKAQHLLAEKFEDFIISIDQPIMDEKYTYLKDKFDLIFKKKCYQYLNKGYGSALLKKASQNKKLMLWMNEYAFNRIEQAVLKQDDISEKAKHKFCATFSRMPIVDDQRFLAFLMDISSSRLLISDEIYQMIIQWIQSAYRSLSDLIHGDFINSPYHFIKPLIRKKDHLDDYWCEITENFCKKLPIYLKSYHLDMIFFWFFESANMPVKFTTFTCIQNKIIDKVTCLSIDDDTQKQWCRALDIDIKFCESIRYLPQQKHDKVDDFLGLLGFKYKIDDVHTLRF